MKIVVLDGYTENPGDLSWDGLKAFGDLTVYDRSSLTDPKDAINRIGDAEIVFTNKTPITKEVLDACPNIRFIAVLATGYNVVDVAYAKEKGIPVSNVPTYGTDSVSQFAIALLLELCHHIGHHSKTVYEGKWQNHIDWCYWDFPLIELAGKTMGIIGFGRIGHRTGQIAKALNMRVIVNDGFKNPAFVEEGFEYVDRDTLYAQSDVVVLHCPLFPDTMGMINKDSIAKMKDGVMIINNSRGPLVVEADLRDALNSGKVAGAAVDVVATEPIKADNPLLQAKNCIITPHMSWGAKEARQRIMDISVANVKAFVDGNPQNVVNK
jgi:glycerate dehydrogenase